MLEKPNPSTEDAPVSRRRYVRERTARHVAEGLLEAKSRELYEVNQRLQAQAEALEQAVRARTAEALEAASARFEAEQASEAKSNFLASMSHEIRTPLHGVMGMVSALQDTQLSAEQREMVGVITESGRVLDTVINDILDLSKVEANKLELAPEQFFLPSMFFELERQYATPENTSVVPVTFTLDPSAQTWVSGDEMRLRQVVGNLLSNAKKFTSRGSVSLVAKLGRVNGQLRLNVRVKDTGIGLTDEVKCSLFEPFAQANARIAHQFGGSGLGLMISRRICRMMGGDLWLESEAGVGTEAILDVVLTAAKPPKAEPVQDDIAGVEAVLGSRRWKVLIVDDSVANRKVAVQFLKKFQLDIVVANNGVEAIAAWKEQHSDIILMDINMPIMGGVEAAIEIRRDCRELVAGHVPIIAVTANVMSHQVKNYLEAGLDAHLAKPITRKKLLTVIANHLQKSSGGAR